jgi:hypothetical protein
VGIWELVVLKFVKYLQMNPGRLEEQVICGMNPRVSGNERLTLMHNNYRC